MSGYIKTMRDLEAATYGVGGEAVIRFLRLEVSLEVSVETTMA